MSSKATLSFDTLYRLCCRLLYSSLKISECVPVTSIEKVTSNISRSAPSEKADFDSSSEDATESRKENMDRTTNSLAEKRRKQQVAPQNRPHKRSKNAYVQSKHAVAVEHRFHLSDNTNSVYSGDTMDEDESATDTTDSLPPPLGATRYEQSVRGSARTTSKHSTNVEEANASDETASLDHRTVDTGGANIGSIEVRFIDELTK